MRMRLKGSVLALSAVLSGTMGCEQARTGPMGAPVIAPALRNYVTGQAAADLDPQGQFAHAGAPVESDLPMITPAHAAEMAVAFVRTWGRHYKAIWEKSRGGSIDLASLQPDARVLFADTPYGRFPDGFHPAFTRAFGPWYLVTMKDGAAPVMVIAVSAYNTDQPIDGHGFLVQPRLGGNDFETLVIPRDTAGFRPLSPEEAVNRIGRETGVRVERTPELHLMDYTRHPAIAVWKLALERPVAVRRGNAAPVSYEKTLFAGPMGRYYLARPTQPGSIETYAIRYTASGERLGPATAIVPVRPGHPAEFDEVALAKEQN